MDKRIKRLHISSISVGVLARKALVVASIVSPVLGALTSRLFTYPEPVSFWQGLVVQLFLSISILDFMLSRNALRSVGLSFHKNAVSSVILFVFYSIAYASLLLILSYLGIDLPHFDQARKLLGTVIVVSLYVPFWGLLEGFWISYLISRVSLALKQSSVSWKSLIISSVIFGVLHIFVNIGLGATLQGSIGYMVVAFTLLIAGSIFVITKNPVGTILFWVVFNF